MDATTKFELINELIRAIAQLLWPIIVLTGFLSIEGAKRKRHLVVDRLRLGVLPAHVWLYK
jgi:hypothetical protein